MKNLSTPQPTSEDIISQAKTYAEYVFEGNRQPGTQHEGMHPDDCDLPCTMKEAWAFAYSEIRGQASGKGLEWQKFMKW